ncbi:hypothetical protein T01_13265 [Trichinella spiralis]|uniref:Uncharacterized protein n=1 Tax=Trichinella spiralis TaxID=6334 RepID=A0A0V0Z4S2_TRISP|nr:hypothetical protein T01_13265 [Trichinella spiralis]
MAFPYRGVLPPPTKEFDTEETNVNWVGLNDSNAS